MLNKKIILFLCSLIVSFNCLVGMQDELFPPTSLVDIDLSEMGLWTEYLPIATLQDWFDKDGVFNVCDILATPDGFDNMRTFLGHCFDYVPPRPSLKEWIRGIRFTAGTDLMDCSEVSRCINKFLLSLNGEIMRTDLVEVLEVQNFCKNIVRDRSYITPFNFRLLRVFPNLRCLRFALGRMDRISESENFWGPFKKLNTLEVVDCGRDGTAHLLKSALRLPALEEVTWVRFSGVNFLIGYGSPSVCKIRLVEALNLSKKDISEGNFLRVSKFPSLQGLYFDCCRDVEREDLEMGVRTGGFGQIRVFWRDYLDGDWELIR